MSLSRIFFTTLLTIAFQINTPHVFAEDASASSGSATTRSSTPFHTFTGRVNKNKVRLRQQPNLESPIMKVANQGDLLIVVGENDDFYAVEPPADIKAYIFRTYVLDNVVEGNRINVRLHPDVDAPVIAQLNGGDRVEGTISPQNNKWLEIAVPKAARFYISKDYVENIGGPQMMATIQKRRDDVNLLLNSTTLAGQSEMQKSFPEINLESVYANLNKIATNYTDFPEQVARAKAVLAELQDAYLKKKLSYLEAKAKMTQEDWQEKNSHLTQQMQAQQQRLSQLEQQLQTEKGRKPVMPQMGAVQSGSYISNKMSAWLPIEQEVYNNWARENGNRSQEEFYEDQKQNAVVLTGIIEPYSRSVRNKPGDYVLLNQSSHLPIAYLYSTQVNLQDKIGQSVTIQAVPRNNNNFAFPAYFVLYAN